MKLLIEIRAGEGGDDSKLFIYDILRMYQRYFQKIKVKSELLTSEESFVSIEINGKNLDSFLQYEPGIHRVQRVPPTETKGRRHTSTVSVVVLELPEYTDQSELGPIEISNFRGTGPGGQHRNTSDTGVRIKHLETGIIVAICNGRSQYQNKIAAFRILKAKLNEVKSNCLKDNMHKKRKEQIGLNNRGGKMRTYNFIENRLKDERLSKPLYCLDKILDGDLSRIYKLI